MVSIKQVTVLLNAQPNTASKLISDFCEHEILRELTGRKRDRLFIFNDYVRLFVE